MTSISENKFADLTVPNSSKYERTPFGKEMLKHFPLDPRYKNLNHGSYGNFPTAIRDKQREYQDLCESAPDPFIRFILPKLLDESRQTVAKFLNAPIEAIVYVMNATTGVNTVLRSLIPNEDGNDEILYFSIIYEACEKTVEYVCESTKDLFKKRKIKLPCPSEDVATINLFKNAIKTSRAEGRNPRVAIFDTISSMPGLRLPFEELTAVCREEGILSLIDGAHGIGHIPIDLTALDPDFFVSNCHKWLHVPRACAVFYVPVRNQHLIRSSLPTSHGFVPREGLENPSAYEQDKSRFVNEFQWVGTMDGTAYLVVPEAIKWREQVCGGESAIINYTVDLTRKAGSLVAGILGTEVMDNSTHTLTNCNLINVVLPLTASPEKINGFQTIDPKVASKAINWIEKTVAEEYKTYIAIIYFQGEWIVRFSGQVYLELSDFEWAGHALKDVCERAAKLTEF
ncbi:pyridoxal phosphate-dependent transferase [Bisporella sp. PMI_857]|nr:pyridoxal phosphate-dependent transferase [Bisporella sp. PMI_857]